MHSQSPAKDLAAFDAALAARFAEAEGDPALPWIDFSGVFFPAEASFRKGAFSKNTSFDAATFRGDADFFRAHFGGYASFRHAEFSGDAYFRNAKFASYADFSSANFADYASFREACFSRPAYFDGAAFHGDSSFRAARFAENVYCIGAAFSDASDFRFAVFSGKAYFDGAAFSGETSFDSASFKGAVYFESGAFSGGVSFNAAMFCGDADFRFAAFYGDASFDDLKLEGGAYFAGAAFPNSNSDKVTRFTNLLPQSARRLRLEGARLDRVSFLWSAASEIQFVSCRWPRLQGRSVIYDEIALDAPAIGEGRSFLQVGDLYRQLRLNLATSKQIMEAGDFYIGEMEMRRRDAATYPWQYRGLLSAYRLLSMHGQSYTRPLIFYLLGGVIFAILYLAAGFRGASESTSMIGQLAQACGRALTAGALFAPPSNFHSPWDSLVRYINTIWALALVGLLALALRRRFRS